MSRNRCNARALSLALCAGLTLSMTATARALPPHSSFIRSSLGGAEVHGTEEGARGS